MATSKITNIGSGVYFREIDLTTATQSAGTFAGGAIVLTEKGPAFEVMQTSTFAERTVRLGGLNPNFPSSYYAQEFLEQAQNYKEIRMLGLEGYSDTTGFVIMYNNPINTAAAAVTGVSPVIADLESIACVLKPRRTDMVGTNKEITRVDVLASPTPTDESFTLLLTRADATTLQVICSLRPESREYISKVFGADPRDKTLVSGVASPLWVEFVIPSIKQKPTATSTAAYYYASEIGNVGSPTSQTSLSLIDGNMTVDVAFSYPTTSVTNVIATGTVFIDFGIVPPFTVGQLVNVSGVTGTGNVASVNALWSVDSVVGTTIGISDPTTFSTALGIAGTYTAGGTVQLHYAPTWENDVLQLGGSPSYVPFQTPITPWFVSDADANGNVKRLFRLWSISDGEAADTEIKIEITGINPAGNNGFGSFDIYVRDFNDSEDGGIVRRESFVHLTMNPKSSNYIERRIGDGEDFQLQSRYIFVELNQNEVLPPDALPYGVEGYPNVSGITMPDQVWTTEYNFSKPLNKQILGLANNQLNMFSQVAPDSLTFKNVADLDAVRGIGFHLNPNNNGAISTAEFSLANQTIYQVSATNTNTAAPSVIASRSSYVVCFFGGFDGWNVYAERTWDNTTSKDYESLSLAVDAFSDKESIDADFSVLVTPDINFEDHPNATNLVLQMVEGRGDALYIFDFSYDTTADPQQAADNLQASDMKSSASATYFPYVQIQDDTNKVNSWMPPSIIALATVAATATNEQVWQPPAGSLRTVSSHLVRTRRRMKINDREILKGASINPITLFPGSGFEITESRTTQSTFSALSFIHNRLLLGYAKKALNQTLRPLLQQLGSEITKNAFVTTVTPIFDRIKKLNGVEEFKVSVLNPSDDRVTLNGQIVIVPLYPIERIIVDFVLTDNAVTFTQA